MRKALGRGLDALLPPHPIQPASDPGTTGRPLKVPLAKIRPNHLQPRRHFDPEKLSELAASIRKHGLAQPLLVSKDGDGTYELIAGERRLRACQLAGLTEVEIVVRQPATDEERLAVTLIENLQREDLNAIETALGYQRLIKEFGLDQDRVSSLVAKSKSAVSNTMRLLQLPEEVQKAVQLGQLQEGHARALLMVEDPLKRHELFKRAVAERLPVRELEDAARLLNGVDVKRVDRRPVEPKARKSAEVLEFERLLQHRFGNRVEIRESSENTGTIVIHYHGPQDFERIIQLIQ